MPCLNNPFSGQKASRKASGADHLSSDEGFRVLLSQNLAPWLRRVEALPALARLAPDQRRWRLIWAQQFLLYLARRQITAPAPEHAAAFVAASSTGGQPLRFPEQVEEAAALVFAALPRMRTAFAGAARREGRHDSQTGQAEGRRQKAEGRRQKAEGRRQKDEG